MNTVVYLESIELLNIVIHLRCLSAWFFFAGPQFDGTLERSFADLPGERWWRSCCDQISWSLMCVHHYSILFIYHISCFHHVLSGVSHDFFAATCRNERSNRRENLAVTRPSRVFVCAWYGWLYGHWPCGLFTNWKGLACVVRSWKWGMGLKHVGLMTHCKRYTNISRICSDFLVVSWF